MSEKVIDIDEENIDFQDQVELGDFPEAPDSQGRLVCPDRVVCRVLQDSQEDQEFKDSLEHLEHRV